MSRGPGRIERAVKAAFDAEPNRTFTVDDLRTLVFPGVERLEKKHRVTLIRAAKRVVSRHHQWRVARAPEPGAPLIFFSGPAEPTPSAWTSPEERT